jgi:hypothetical protein
MKPKNDSNVAAQAGAQTAVAASDEASQSNVGTPQAPADPYAKLRRVAAEKGVDFAKVEAAAREQAEVVHSSNERARNALTLIFTKQALGVCPTVDDAKAYGEAK